MDPRGHAELFDEIVTLLMLVWANTTANGRARIDSTVRRLRQLQAHLEAESL